MPVTAEERDFKAFIDQIARVDQKSWELYTSVMDAILAQNPPPSQEVAQKSVNLTLGNAKLAEALEPVFTLDAGDLAQFNSDVVARRQAVLPSLTTTAYSRATGLGPLAIEP